MIQIKLESPPQELMPNADSAIDEIPLNLEVKPSPISGRGVFAKTNIARDTNFGRYCPSSNIIVPPETGTYYGLQITYPGTDEEVFIDGLDHYGDIVHWTALMNHSFSPNIRFQRDVTVCALRDIKVGEELVVDYGVMYWQKTLPILQPFREEWIRSLLTHEPKPEQIVMANSIRKSVDVAKICNELGLKIQNEVVRRKSFTEEDRMKYFSSIEHKIYPDCTNLKVNDSGQKRQKSETSTCLDSTVKKQCHQGPSISHSASRMTARKTIGPLPSNVMVNNSQPTSSPDKPGAVRVQSIKTGKIIAVQNQKERGVCCVCKSKVGKIAVVCQKPECFTAYNSARQKIYRANAKENRGKELNMSKEKDANLVKPVQKTIVPTATLVTNLLPSVVEMRRTYLLPPTRANVSISMAKSNLVAKVDFQPSTGRDDERAFAGGTNSAACILHALNACVPGCLTSQDLDNAIPLLFHERRKVSSNGKRILCGIEGVTWHQQCIFIALRTKFGPTGFSFQILNSVKEGFEKGFQKLYIHGCLQSSKYPEAIHICRGLQRACAIDSNPIDNQSDICKKANFTEFQGIEWQEKEKQFGHVWYFKNIWQICGLSIHNPPLLPNLTHPLPATQTLPTISHQANASNNLMSSLDRSQLQMTSQVWVESIPKQYLNASVPIEYWSEC
jgi:hypothetical protein